MAVPDTILDRIETLGHALDSADRKIDGVRWQMAEAVAQALAAGIPHEEITARWPAGRRHVRKYAKVWEQHGASDITRRPSFWDAYELAGYDDPAQREALTLTAAAMGNAVVTTRQHHRETVDAVRDALASADADPEVRREIARAVARDTQAAAEVARTQRQDAARAQKEREAANTGPKPDPRPAPRPSTFVVMRDVIALQQAAEAVLGVARNVRGAQMADDLRAEILDHAGRLAGALEILHRYLDAGAGIDAEIDAALEAMLAGGAE